MTDRTERACPNCGEAILVSARKCKHCKSWLTEEPAPVQPPVAAPVVAVTPPPPVPPPARGTAWMPIVAVIGLLVLGGGAFALWSSRASRSTVPAETAATVDVAPVSGAVEERVVVPDASMDPLPRSSPERGSPLRKALMDAMRPELERTMGAPVMIMVRLLEVEGQTAFFVGYPVHADGRPFTDEEQARAFEDEVYDGVDPTMAWLVRTAGGWSLKSLLINQSDVGWLDWCTDPPLRALMGGYCTQFGR